jgi:hypothetical protein
MKSRLNFVNHPRYGDLPIRSPEGYTEDDLRRAFWSYGRPGDREIIFPETAIQADVTKQNFWELYVDIARRCRKCQRWFIFFALEQKYWYEELGFYVYADCVHCHECRHETQVLKARIERYGALLGQTEKTTEEWQELSGIADSLWEIGYIRKPGTLQKSRMPKRLRGT